MNLDRGEVVALLGPNGSGKTTSFYCIAGLITPRWGGYRHHRWDRRHGLPDVPPGGVPGSATFRRKCRSFAACRSRTTSWRFSRSPSPSAGAARNGWRNFCRSSRSSICAGRPPCPLSGGERRRAEIARCLASNPRYVLLDEPFAGVDPIAVGDIRHLVSDLKTRGIGVLITDHNVRENPRDRRPRLYPA